MNLVERFHERYIRERRVRVLADIIAPLLPRDASVLDVGCGDGRLADAIGQRRPDTVVTGIDVLVRPGARIPVRTFDGARVPFADASIDVVMFIDVLHHTHHAESLLADARRIARRVIILKDHSADGFLAGTTLRVMDGVGNARFGVSLPHLYFRWAEWQQLFERLQLGQVMVQRQLSLYPTPLSILFDRSLHFVAVLDRLPGRHTPVERGASR